MLSLPLRPRQGPRLYIAGSDVPAFVVNVQRGGPGLGGIQPSQSDYFQATKGASDLR